MPNHQPITAITFTCGVCGSQKTEMRIRHRKIGTCSDCRATRRKRQYWADPESARKSTTKWRKANAQRARETVDRWHKDEANRQRRIDYHRQHYLANKADYNAAGRRQYRADPDKWKRQAKEWRLSNIERVRANAKRWHGDNPHKVRANSERRRGRYVGTFTGADIARLVISQKNQCANHSCRVSLENGYHIDHIMPLARGGTNWPDNIQLLCAPCNLQKGAKDPYKWAQENGRLFV